MEYLRVSAIGFAKQIAGNSDSKIKIGSINELSFSAENEFAHGMSVNSRKSRVVTENKKYYIQTISKIQLVTKSCYIETVDNITSVYSDRDMYCTIYQFILIGVALFASILLVIFSKLLTRPLVKLKDASKEVAEGNFNMRVKESHGITSSTEITELSQSFNTMADYVEDYIEQLKLATQNRDNFIADFTHELKTPLTSVIGYADMLRSYEMEPKQRRECADLIYKEGSRLEALSLHLLNLIVLKNDEIKTVNIKTDIIADDIKKSVLFILKKYGVKLKLNVEKAEVNAEPSLLKTLLYNLIDNACKAESLLHSRDMLTATDTVFALPTAVAELRKMTLPKLPNRFIWLTNPVQGVWAEPDSGFQSATKLQSFTAQLLKLSVKSARVRTSALR